MATNTTQSRPPNKPPFWRSRNFLITAAVAALALGGGMTFALWPKNYDKIINDLAKKGPEEIRKAVDSGAVPREVAWEAFGQAREAEMQQRMDGYFALQTAAERNKYLDKMIDEMQARMREWQQRSSTRPSNWQGRRDGNGPQTRPSEAQRAEMEKRRAARADSTPPQQHAQRVEFMAAMRKRMQERGIQMPGGRGGFGMFGGGRGGGGGRGPGRPG